MSSWKRKKRLVLLVTVVLLGTVGCGKKWESQVDQERSDTTKAGSATETSDVTDGSATTETEKEVADTDYQKQYEKYCENSISQFLQQNWGENPQQGAVLYSPVNLYMALEMLSEMSGGKTRQQLQDGLLGFTAATSFCSSKTQTAKGEEKQTQIRKTQDWLCRQIPSDVCTFGNSLWFRDQYDFSDDITNILKKDYHAQCTSGKMGNRFFDRKIQKWLDRQTGGKLSEEISKNIQTDPDMVMMLLSAANYKDQWNENLFDPVNTRKDTFYGRNFYTCGNTTEGEKRNKVTCDFMNTSWSGACMENKRFQAVSIPMKETQMTVILPKEGVAFDKVSNRKSVAEILKLCDPKSKKWEQGLVTFSMPKLDFQSDLNLCPLLEGLDITKIFQHGKADFGSVWKNDRDRSKQDLYVSEARQASAVKVDESGCSVASYTQIAIKETMMMPDKQMEMKCNRPFIILVSDKKGTPLFAGAVSRIE